VFLARFPVQNVAGFNYTGTVMAHILAKYYRSGFPMQFWYRGVPIAFRNGKVSVWGITLFSLDQALDSVDVTLQYLAEHPELKPNGQLVEPRGHRH
jgi:hypothetical protein